jgi:N-acylneuraminate cytidylyltransferase
MAMLRQRQSSGRKLQPPVEWRKLLRSAAIIPVKSLSRRVAAKNFRPFRGKPLFEHFFDRVPSAPFDGIYVDTDSEAVAASAQRRGWEAIERKPELAADSANGNDLLVYEAGIIDADAYFQLFVTAPLLRPGTISRAVEALASDPGYDSVFTAVAIYSWFWCRGMPVNYDPLHLPRSQDATPVIRETTGLYGIRREALLSRRCRIGERPLPLLVSDLEALDIDTEMDLRIAEACFGISEPDSS